MSSKGNPHAPVDTQAGNAYQNMVEEGRTSDRGKEEIVRQYGSEAGGNQPVDHLTLSEQDRQDLGLKPDDLVIYPARQEAIGWKGRRRFAEVQRKYGEAHQVFYVQGDKKGQDPCAHRENMMVKVPREAAERIEAERVRRGQEYIKRFRPVAPDSDQYEMEVDIFDKTQENYRRRKRANAEMFRQMRIGEGSPTARMSFEEGLEYYERRGVDINALEDRIRRGGTHTPRSQENWSSPQGSPQRPGSGKKSIVSGFGAAVNPNSALGQVQQRNARAANSQGRR